MRNPEPVSGHFSGTAGPAPGMNFTLLPFTTCRETRHRETSCVVLPHCCGPELALYAFTMWAILLLSVPNSRG